MLRALQKQLADIYQADCGHSVTDYLITDRTVAANYCSIDEGTEETVLVANDDGGIAMSVFLDEALLARLDSCNPIDQIRFHQLADLMLVLEGISHFNYIGWCAGRDKAVTLLELELQAEIDKFVVTCLLALAQDDHELLRTLHCRLFENTRFKPSLNAAERERYQTASNYAARFCRRLRDRIGDEVGALELRRFYRMTQPEKISHIHSLAWNA